jgi:ABC-type cobalamin/Fe3+-siderophores transport system ATPase subunit
LSAVYQLEGVGVRLGAAQILTDVSLALRAAEMTAVVGPNGAGKSTLMSVLSGFRPHYEGHCRFRGREISEWKKPELAKQMAFVPQMVRIEFPFTGEQVVFMGRTPYCNGLFESPDDRDAVRRAMELTDASPFAERPFQALSGGERQRIVLAGALAQEPAVLLLDEPTTFLDLKHQIQTYRLLQRLAREGMAVVAVTHDLNLASSYADRMVVLSRGRVAADGTPGEVMRADLLREVFEVDVEIRSDHAGRPWAYYCQAPGETAS